MDSLTARYDPDRSAAIRVPPPWVGEFYDLERQARPLISDWIKAKTQHRECLIRAALLRFLTPFEIDLTSTTKSKALLDYYGLLIEHINAPGVLRNGPNTFLPETLRIYQHGKLALSVNLEMNREAVHDQG